MIPSNATPHLAPLLLDLKASKTAPEADKSESKKKGKTAEDDPVCDKPFANEKIPKKNAPNAEITESKAYKMPVVSLLLIVMISSELIDKGFLLTTGKRFGFITNGLMLFRQLIHLHELKSTPISNKL